MVDIYTEEKPLEMNKESRYQLQCIDCNCNDCKFMVRDFDALELSKKKSRDYYAWSYRFRRRYFWDEAQKKLKKGKLKKYRGLLRERARIGLDTSYKSGLSFGNCIKFNKPVSFIPNTCQLETQECFEHRR